MDEKLLEGIIIQLAELNKSVEQLVVRLDKTLTDFTEFSERFEEVMTQLEDERRLDITRDYN